MTAAGCEAVAVLLYGLRNLRGAAVLSANGKGETKIVRITGSFDRDL